MESMYHKFHIPVMGTGHSIDTPIRVAPFGISSVISIVDDVLIDKVRRFYSEKFKLPFIEISKKDSDARAKRITAYLNLVGHIVHLKMEEIKQQPFFKNNDKSKYFQMLPDNSPIKHAYNRLHQIKNEFDIEKLGKELTNLMRPGAIDVNIMAKVDRTNYGSDGNILSEEFSDAKAALRGFANSNLTSSVIFSAGFNRSLFSYISQFNDFYRDKTGELKKKITIKVSDFRSALIQGKFLAMKGLEVSEFRIESGLNCGGHAFPAQGYLLPSILEEFQKKKAELTKQLQPLIRNFYKNMGWDYTEHELNNEPKITVQGGIGTSGEARRLTEGFGCNATGWGSPFLLVPEATCVDKETFELLKNASKEDLYLSNSSPLGVPFNNLRKTGSELWTKDRAEKGRPGSACPKGFLVSNTQFTEKPICTASRQYQAKKVEEISRLQISDQEKEELNNSVYEKVCLCEHLGNGALIALGIEPKSKSPQAICPGPNIVWFNKEYTLMEMVDHIYGRGESLVSEDRPHMFCQEIELYVNYFEKLVSTTEQSPAGIKYLETFKENIEAGMDLCVKISEEVPYPFENLESIPSFVSFQREKLRSIVLDKMIKLAI
ncbi:MAG: hypothetical protein ACYCVH_11765 [Ignavibacteriaceae bacterium]